MEDYIILQDYDSYWHEIFFFDHYLTNGEIERIENAVQKVKDELPGEYTSEDVEQAIGEIVPYTKTITLSEMDDHKTIYY
jgi:hypothetical protein